MLLLEHELGLQYVHFHDYAFASASACAHSCSPALAPFAPSILFLLLTLAAYVFEPSLRDQLMGKMTIIFICNLTICFIVAVSSWFQVLPLHLHPHISMHL